MPKISDLMEVADLTGTETVVMVKAGHTRRGPIGALVDAAVAPSLAAAESSANVASDYADLAQAAALSIGNVYQDTDEGLGLVANGQYFWTASPLTLWLKSGGLAIQKAQLVTNTQLDLKVSKSDLPRNALDYVSLDAAVATALPGDTIFIPDGARLAPLSAKLTKSLKFIGSRKPSAKADLTGLENGSIICGPLIYDADNCEFHNLGVDSGGAVCDEFHGGVAQEGLICTVTHATSDHVGLRVSNVICIAQSATVSVHAFAAERQIGAIIDGVETVFGLYGQAYKVVRSNVSNLITSRSGSAGVIIKRDELAACYESNFNQISIDCTNGVERGTNGLVLESRRGDDDSPETPTTPGNLYSINISNLTVFRPLWHGIIAQGAQENTDTVADVNITNATLIEAGLDGFTTLGKTLRLNLTNVRSLKAGRFGFSDTQPEVASQSSKTKLVACWAVECASGFVGFGLNYQPIDCEAHDNEDYGFYAKNGSSSYRMGNRGSGNGIALYGNDNETYWFELAAPYQEQRIAPALLNDWVNYDDTEDEWERPRFWMGSDGKVHFEGVMKDGTMNSPAFNLPPGFRCAAFKRFKANGLGADVIDCYIASNGDFVPVFGPNGFVSLDGISFLPSRGDG